MDNVDRSTSGPTRRRRRPRADDAVLIGPDGDERRRPKARAALDTINYEITCGLTRARAARLPPRRGAGVSERLAGDRPRGARRRSRAWLVGGAVRDRLLGRADAATSTSSSRATCARPPRGARARRRGGASSRCRRQFGAWRVVAPRPRAGRPTSRRCRATRSSSRPRARDFTVNAMAEPLAGGEPIDPHGGARRPRGAAACGWSSADGLRRPTRCACCGSSRFACELGLDVDPGDGGAGRRGARRGLRAASPGARLRRAQADRRRAATRSAGSR